MQIVLTIDPTARFCDRCERMKRVEKHLKRSDLSVTVRFPIAGNYSLCEFLFRPRSNATQADETDTRFAKRVAVRLKAELLAASYDHGDGLERIFQFWPERFRGYSKAQSQVATPKPKPTPRPTCTYYQTFDECGSAWLHARRRETYV